jgi:hypothetical protein
MGLVPGLALAHLRRFLGPGATAATRPELASIVGLPSGVFRFHPFVHGL